MTLNIHFPQHSLQISQLPETAVTIVAAARHKKTLLIKASTGHLYSPRLGWHKGHIICQWHSDRALDFLPALHRLRLLPKGCSIKEARRINAAERKADARHHQIIELRQVCQRLGIKTPRIPKLKAK